MSEDVWTISALVSVDHVPNCDCRERADEFGVTSRNLYVQVLAVTAEIAKAEALRHWRWQTSTDSRCDVDYDTAPILCNVSEWTRDRALLKAWNDGLPIRA